MILRGLFLVPFIIIVFIIVFLTSPLISRAAELPADLTDLSLEYLMQVTVYSAYNFDLKTTDIVKIKDEFKEAKELLILEMQKRPS